MAKRNISKETVLLAIENATKKQINNDVTTYQCIIVENNKSNFVRVFVNEEKIPPMIITVYKTSKIDKY